MPKFRAVLYRGKYYAVWREDGEIKRRSLRTADREAAERALKRFEADYEEANRPETVTVTYVWEHYRQNLGSRPAGKTMLHESKSVLPFFGRMAADAITEDDCLHYQEARAAQSRKPGTVWTELGRLRAALRWGEKKRLIAKAPAIFRPSPGAPRDLRMTWEESRLFVEACAMPHVRLFAILALTTGARMGAILGLTWDRVDFETARIDFSDPRRVQSNKRRALVPMNGTARAALSEALRGSTTGFVIEWSGKPVQSIKKGLAATGRRCGLSWVTAHVLRHTAASRMAESGVPMDEIAQILGHSDVRTTRRIYARFSPDYLQGAARALEMDFMKATETDKARK